MKKTPVLRLEFFLALCCLLLLDCPWLSFWFEVQVWGQSNEAGLPAAATTGAAAAAATEAAAATAAAATEAATTAAATTTAAAEATTAAAAAAASASFTRAGFVDGEIATINVLAVEGSDGSLSFRVVGHFDEAETAGAAGVTVHDEGRRSDLTESSEEILELRLRGLEREIADVHLHDTNPKPGGQE
jgi:hypothetical protein